MPHIPVHPSARKRERQNLKRRERNRAIKTHVHTAVKRASEAITGKDAAQAGAELKQATRVVHKAVSSGAMHRNTASRKIARLARRLHRAQSAAKS
jgi:small subunit ribosomal protein S20